LKAPVTVYVAENRQFCVGLASEYPYMGGDPSSLLVIAGGWEMIALSLRPCPCGASSWKPVLDDHCE
jgi:hypothetical protein